MDSAPQYAAGQVITIFRSRTRAGVKEEYEALGAAMLDLARAMPGFVDFKMFGAPDGENVSVITFADHSSQTAWRTQVDHRAAQSVGRERLYASYSLQSGTCETAHVFEAPG